ncbi:head-tail connector protein [Sphingomonas sp. TREG-RG-20F-R18-01]|uniref:head-tail connector protein n=1 Tax=Sphingomonas sp. TREG-RG-20F-R18-01 TaxID=2914982 RepID=UPI001F58EC41|nr:head-tail connector protein [Sphingomonas sp. TREG-RG-20F-R18-01]
MTLQTVADMRAFLTLSADLADDQVIELYGAYLAGQAVLPVLSLAAVKKNLRVDTTDDDDLISDLILVAQADVEAYTGLVLTPRTVTETAPQLGRWIDLKSWPVSAVTAVRWTDRGGFVNTIDPSSWTIALARRPVRMIPKAWHWGLASAFPPVVCGVPLPQLPIEIDVEAGYATPADVPANVKQAMHLLVAHFYNNREATEVGARAAAIEIPFGVERLLRKPRLRTI